MEANRTEICSGWRPLFGTLRVANSKNNAAAILDVFKIFLSTDNTLVFANAALDYILCLISHIKNSNIDDTPLEPLHNINQYNEKKSIFLDKESDFPSKLLLGPVDLCIESLKLLQNCASILSVIYNMPKCPNFNLTHRVNIDTNPQLVDPVIQNSEIHSFNQINTNQINYESLSTQIDFENCEKDKITLAHMDKQSNILKIHYILLEGLASSSTLAATKNQPYIVETLFKLIRDLIENPGINFGFYCINHILLPMVQNWLRQNSKIQKPGEVWQNFKHCCGLASELVVDYLYELQKTRIESDVIEHPGATLSLKQLLIILIECISQPSENIARLGSSCIRHVMLSAGKILTVYQWEVLITALHRACTVSLNPLYQLSLVFNQYSDSFYGDLATVKVAARKDTSVSENERLYELAQQVFLMQNQRYCNKCQGKACECENNKPVVIDDRSYVFLLYPYDCSTIMNPDMYTIRVPFKNLVVGILAHQMLIQTVSSALLQNLNHITPILNILQINSCSLRGVLTKVNAKHVDVLLKCLEISNMRAKEFDVRPGLKFLLQKVGNLNKAANLYTQANTSEVVQIIVLIELCLDGIDKYSIDPRNLKDILARDEKTTCMTDLDYVENFLKKLYVKWNKLCDSYVNLTLVIPEVNEESDEETIASETYPKPFKLTDFKQDDDNDNLSISTDTDSYLEKDLLPNLKKDDNDIDKSELKVVKLQHSYSLDENLIQKKRNNTDNNNSTDDETNEKAASKYNTKLVYEKYKIELNAIKYDKNTLLQMRKSTISSDNINTDYDKPNEPSKLKSSQLWVKDEPKKGLGQNSMGSRSNPFNINSLPPPQPVPSEIQQQRILSMFKVRNYYYSNFYLYFLRPLLYRYS